MLVSYGIFLLIWSSGEVLSQLTWEYVDSNDSPGGPSHRRDAGMGYDAQRNRLVIFGGQTIINNAKIILGDTWIYDISKKVWSEVRKEIQPSPRFKVVYGVSNGKFYIATGQDANNNYLDDIWSFDFSTEEWGNLPAQEMPDFQNNKWTVQSRDVLKPSYRFGASGGIYPNSSNFYVAMGYGEELEGSVYSYETLTSGWFLDFAHKNPYNPTYPHARYDHSATLMAPDELLIFGGCLSGGKSGGSCPSSDSWVFDGRSKEWTNIGGCAAPTMNAGMAMLPSVNGQRRAVLYGGIQNTRQVLLTIKSPPDQIAVFNPDTLSWTLRTTSHKGELPVHRSSVAMATGPNGIYMFGGMATYMYGRKDPEQSDILSDLWLLRGDALSADQASMSAPCNPTFFSLPILHGILMVIGYGFFLPWGGFIARYARHRSNKWFRMHVVFQVFGLIMAIAGFIVAIISVRGSHFQFVHGIIGIIATALTVLQPFNAAVRPRSNHIGEPKTLRRLVWEVCHHFSGSSAVLLGLVNVSLGVFFIHSHLIIWAVWFAYLCFFIVVVMIAELNQRWQTHIYGEPHVVSNYVHSKKNGALIIDDRTHRVRQGYHNSALESEG